jgi:hypothetical protein
VPNATTDLSQTDYDVFDGKVYLACFSPTLGYPTNNPHYWDSAGTGVMLLTEGQGKGLNVRTYQSKIYSILNSNLYFSCVGSPLKWHDYTDAGPPSVDYIGSGNINLSTQDAASEQLTGLEVYYDRLAIFSSKATQIWAIASDPKQNSFTQLLRAAGTTASHSALQYGSGDVLYLDQSGVRSLKAKDSSNSAAVSDIGSPIDPVVQTMLADLDPNNGGQAYMDRAIALLEPSIGRFWLVFPNKILVLSYFPGPKITAWSQLNLSFTVAYAATCGGRIFLRDTAHNIWVYGGVNSTSYDNCHVEIRLPYLDGKKPGHKKQFSAFDATVTGTWRVAVSYDYNLPTRKRRSATSACRLEYRRQRDAGL